MEEGRLKWKGGGLHPDVEETAGRAEDYGSVVTLKALEIRTFVIETEGEGLSWMGGS